MASTLKINNLDTASGSTITIPTGKTLVGTDEGSFRVPGTVLQVVENQISVWTPTTSTSFINSGVQATIVPKATSSKILIVGTFNSVYTDSAAEYLHMAVYRAIGGASASDVNKVTSTHGQNYGSGQAGQQYATALCHQFLDSPNTTSSTVYAFYMKSNGGGTVGINNYGSTGNNTSISTITLTEIAQ